MPSRNTLVLAGLLLAALFALPALGDRKEERERKRAWEEAQKSFRRDYTSEDPEVRRQAVLALKDFTDLGACEVIVDKVLEREQDFGVLEASVSVLGATRDGEVVEWLAKKATRKGDWPIRARIVEALGAIPLEPSHEAIRSLLAKEEDPRVLSMALFSATELNMHADMDLVIPLLEHEDWQVRVAAIEALAKFKDEKALVPLIDRLMNERGRLRQDLADALKAITGKNFGRDANRWRKWLHERDLNPEPEKPPDKKDDGHVSSATDDEPTYFGLRVLSDRVLFVIDVSQSMRTEIDVDKMKIAREAAKTGPAGPGEDKDSERFEDTIQWWKIKDRFDLAKAQLKFVIKNLKKDQKFEIVAFSDSVTPWNNGRLVKASASMKAKAIQFVDLLEVEEATAAGAVLDWAFQMAGPGATDKNYKTGVDTIFFLSDGAPTDGTTEEILERVRSRNVLRKIRIHVVAILNYSTRFLRLLAEQNGGVYKLFKVEDKK